MNPMSYEQALKTYPQVKYLVEEINGDMSAVEFAYDVIPNLGPGGATSDEDEEALSEDEDDEEEIAPSLSGEKALMAYAANIDELWICNSKLALTTWDADGNGSTKPSWTLWNY